MQITQFAMPVLSFMAKRESGDMTTFFSFNFTHLGPRYRQAKPRNSVPVLLLVWLGI